MGSAITKVGKAFKGFPIVKAKYNITRGMIFIVHGYAEYIDRYETVAQFFNNQSYSVYGFDHQGD